MVTKVIRSRFAHEVGEQVEGCKIIEVRVVIPPQPEEKRRGVYEYLVEAPPMAAEPRETHSRKKSAPVSNHAPAQGSFTRATPDEMTSRVIRRVPSR